MKFTIPLSCILMLTFSSFSSAKEEYEGLNEYCRGVAAAITALSGITPATRIGRTIAVTTSAASEYMANELMSRKCEKNLTEWNDYYKDNPIDYDEFIRDHCGGNPLTCPGGGSWAVGNPQDCSYYMTCMPGNPSLGGAFSVNDLLMSTSHFKTFWNENTWHVDNRGLPKYAESIR